jgi:hypothetical protein
MGPLAAVLVAFDNKGSALTNVRAQVQPSYLSGRYAGKASQQQGRTDVALTGWGELAAVVEQLNSQQPLNSIKQQQQKQKQQNQQQQPSASAAAAPNWQHFVAHAAYGFEADDVLAAAVQWVSVALALCAQ